MWFNELALTKEYSLDKIFSGYIEHISRQICKLTSMQSRDCFLALKTEIIFNYIKLGKVS